MRHEDCTDCAFLNREDDRCTHPEGCKVGDWWECLNHQSRVSQAEALGCYECKLWKDGACSIECPRKSQDGGTCFSFLRKKA
jgi:hypothetical protein